MKTKIIVLLHAFFILNLFNSCEDFLTIYPEGEIPKEEALRTAEDLRMLQNSTYTVIFSNKFLGGRAQIISEMLTNNVLGSALSGDWSSVYNRSTSFFDGIIREVYAEPYIAVYRANNVLENLSLVEDQVLRNSIEGEARFIRALAHFETVRLFAQPYGFTTDNSHLGIPLKTSSKPQAATRVTVQEIYTFLIEELEACEYLLPNQNDLEYDPNRAYPTKWAAKALLARIYFQMNNFSKAYDYSNQVITSGYTAFNASETEYTARYSQLGTNEALFIGVSATKNNSGETTFANRGGEFTGMIRYTTTAPSVRLTKSAYAFGAADMTDRRVIAWYKEIDESKVIAKYNSSTNLSIPVITITELKLIRAESIAEINGDLLVAQQDLQDILDRAYGVGSRIAPINPTAIILESRIQRRLEFIFEGHLGQDLKRIGALGRETVIIREAPWNCPGAVLQFPNGEIINNPGFIQNPEGGC
jgi:hypothetical protein